jgi:hypothetical protein
MAKRVTAIVTFEVPNDATHEQIAAHLEPGLKHFEGTADLSHIPITGAGARLPSGGASGYETRIWERVTCAAVDPSRGGDDPVDPAVNPAVNPVLNPVNPSVAVHVEQIT